MRPRGSLDALLLGTALAVGASERSAADERTIQGLNIEKTVTCDDRDVVIDGGNHRLTLRGRCRQVWVHGTGHVVHVETLGSADVTGLNNRLEWERALTGDRPDIEITGVGNRAVQAEANAARRSDAGGTSVAVGRRDGTVTITGDGDSVVLDGRSGTVRVESEPRAGTLVIEEGDLQKTFDCGGGSATIESGDNRLTLRRCRELTIHGAENHVVLVGPVRLIRLLGNDNTVEWSEGEGGQPPRVETRGSGNRVTRK